MIHNNEIDLTVKTISTEEPMSYFYGAYKCLVGTLNQVQGKEYDIKFETKLHLKLNKFVYFSLFLDKKCIFYKKEYINGNKNQIEINAGFKSDKDKISKLFFEIYTDGNDKIGIVDSKLTIISGNSGVL